MRHIKNYIKEHGIICWLFIRGQVKKQYGTNVKILYYNKHLSYFDFECAMSAWYDL